MTENQFKFDRDTVATNLKTPIVYDEERMSIGEVLKKLNELSDENEQLRKENDMLFCELSVSVNKEISRNCRIAELEEENEQLKHRIEELLECLNMQDMEIKALRKELHLAHMSSMFSTVKSFKGDISKRYKYSEKTDTIYDTANHYGQYDKILGKKEVTMLLNEYNTLLEESNEE